MSRRCKKWILIGAGLAVLFAAGLIALPEIVRRIAIGKIETATGRVASIDDVDFTLFTGRIAVNGFRLAELGRVNSFVEFRELYANIQLLHLFSGRLRMAEITLVDPTIHVRRTGPAEFNFSDLLPATDAQAAAEPSGARAIPFDFVIERFKIVRGVLTVEDQTITPAQTWKAEGLNLNVRDISTRAEQPGGTARLEFRLGGAPISLKGSELYLVPGKGRATLSVKNFDLVPLLPYLPTDSPATLQTGRMTASLALGYDPERGTEAGGEIRFEQLAVLQRGLTTPVVSAPALMVRVDKLKIKDDEMAMKQLEISGDPTVVDTNLSPALKFDLGDLKISLADVTWPVRGPADLRLTTRLPKEGTLDLTGTIRTSPFEADLHLTLTGADLTPYQSYMPVAGSVSGRSNADLTLAASMEDEFKATMRGTVAINRFGLGPEKDPVLAVEHIEATGVDFRWPSRLVVDRMLLKKLSVNVERNEKGEFPLRATFAQPAVERTQAPESPSTESVIEIKEVEIQEGYGRFVDRTASPPFTEELSGLVANIKGLSSTPGKRGKLALWSVIGATGALKLQGEIDPLGQSLFVDLEGELDDFAVPRINPYAGRLLSWVANDGRLTTKVRFRLEGDQLDADSEIVIDRLNVARSGENDEVERRIGLPLGLIVALLKNVRGEIRIDVPVKGDLGSPQFSLADAVWTAVRNSIVNFLTAPLQLIGKIFTRDGKIAGLAVDPVIFEPGSTAVQPAMEQRVKRITDFLRNSPSIRFSLSAVVSQADMTGLKEQEVTARIQSLQRELNLSDFLAAARRLFKQHFPDKPFPPTVQEMTAALRAVEPLPEDAWRELGRRRLEVTHNRLIESGVVEADRLEVSEEPPTLATSGEGRVEFKILP